MSLLISSGGGGGPITASDITDSSASGRTVLTGTAAQARAALGVGLASTPATRTALSGTQHVLTEASNQVQVFTLSASTIVKLPAESTNAWAFAVFHGGGDYTLSINRSNDTLLTAITAGDATTVVWDGTGIRAY